MRRQRNLYQRTSKKEKKDGKVSAYSAGDLGSIPGSGRSSGEGNGNPLQYSCLENPTDGGAMVGYSPWSRKESDTTERLHFHFSLPMKQIIYQKKGSKNNIYIYVCVYTHTHTHTHTHTFTYTQ